MIDDGSGVRDTTTERLGWVLVAAWLAWAVLAATINRLPQPLLTPYVTSPIFLVLGIAGGRLLAGRGVDARVAGVFLGVSAYILATDVFVGGPRGGPLGYSNANAALAAQSMALSAVVALSARGRVRALLLAAAAVSAAAVVVADSDAGTILLVPLTAAVVAALTLRIRHRTWPVALGAVGIVGAAAAATLLTLLPAWPGRVAQALSPARHKLWGDALTLWASHPVTGAGPGSFRKFTELAKDPDLATAHMSLFQIGAETGAVGVLLFAALVAVGFALAARAHPAATLIAAAALSLLLIHSFVDHLLEYWPIVLVVGLTLGHASAEQPATAPGRSSTHYRDRSRSA